MSTTETKVRHTPGPRTVHQNDREGIHVLAQPHGTIVAEYFNTEADALLDAAAPDMLEALEQCKRWFDENVCDKDLPIAYINTLTVLNKARGIA